MVQAATPRCLRHCTRLNSTHSRRAAIGARSRQIERLPRAAPPREPQASTAPSGSGRIVDIDVQVFDPETTSDMIPDRLCPVALGGMMAGGDVGHS